VSGDDRARRAGALRVSDRFGLSDHGCLGFRDEAERAAAASAWLADGLRAGQRGLFVADLSAEALVAELSAVPDLQGALESGALRVAEAAQMYDLSQPIDAPTQLAAYDEAVSEALADGFTGLRVAADVTPLVLDAARRPSHLAWEQFADRYMLVRPLAPLCLYDTRQIADFFALACVHPLRGPDPGPFGLFAATAGVARLEGELDAGIAAQLAMALHSLPRTDATLDMTGVTFVDGRATAVLYAYLAARRAEGAPLLALQSRAVGRVWQLCGFDELLLEPAGA
jgi:anti-anti-sigma factor